MITRFKYRRSRGFWLAGILWLLVFIGAGVAIYLLTEGDYMRAWLLSILGALAILFSLSIPKYIRVTENSLQIRCLIEVTRIEMENIASIRRIERREYSRMIPVAAGVGLFGYYGYFLDLRKWEFIKVYATQRSNLVEIEDIYEQKYIISAAEPELLVKTVMGIRFSVDRE